MNDNDILKQIALLNPRIISDVDSTSDFIIQSDTSSPIEANIDHPAIENEDDNDILNLWSSTKIFFDPFDPSKINPTTQSQGSVNLTSNNFSNDAIHLTEREIDRQRYTRLKQQKQSVYARRGRRSKNGGIGRNNDNTNCENNNLFNKNELLNINEIHNLLLNDENNKKNNENNLLQASSSNVNTTSSLAPTHGLMPNLSQTLNNNNNNNNKINNSISPINNPINSLNNSVQSINFNLPLEKINNTISNTNTINNSFGNDKNNKDLYSQLLDSINSKKGETLTKEKEVNSTTILGKVNDRSKEIADKKKRRSAATMRCRERKKNQLQKKEQYIKYLENQILFLNGSILHMSNEITWLRRSFLDQYGEQSLKNIYMKNGFKDINFNNVLYPGSSPFSSSTFTNTSMLSPDMTLSPTSGQGHNQGSDQEQEMELDQDQSPSPNIHQNTAFLSPISQSSLKNINNTISSNTSTINTTTTTTTTNNNNNNTNTNTIHPVISNSNDIGTNINSNKNSTTSVIPTPTTKTTTNNYPDKNSNLLSSLKTNTTTERNTSTDYTPVHENTSTSYADQKDIFSQLDIETLNEFANLTKEQRDVILKILEKQQIHTNDKTSETETVTPTHSSTSRNYINIANDVESIDHLSKQHDSLLNLVPTSSTATTLGLNSSSSQFNSLTTNMLNTFNNHGMQTLSSYQSTSMIVDSSHPSTTSPSLPNSTNITNNNLLITTSKSSNTNDIILSSTAPDLLNSTTAVNETTTANNQNSDYINLDNLIYYI
eukprot:jgi/Orpsp1_1/1180043/evm.model.c7180000071944.1